MHGKLIASLFLKLPVVPGSDADLTKMKSEDCMPDTLEALAEWAHLHRERDRGHTRYTLLHTPTVTVPAAVLREVGIRVQGFIHAMSLSATGDWDLYAPCRFCPLFVLTCCLLQ